MRFFFSAAGLLCLAGVLSQHCTAQTSQSGLDLTAIDRSAQPCQDFYQFACGNWMKQHEIPPEESEWGAFNVVFDRNQQILRELLEDAGKQPNRSPEVKQVGGFYQSCMNEEEIEKRALQPLETLRAKIEAIQNKSDLLGALVMLHRDTVDVFFNLMVQPDPEDAKMMIASIDQGGLGLPERDYYFRDDARSIEIRNKYVAHVAKILALGGIPAKDADSKAKAIMALETDLAKASLDVTSLRDPQQVVHPYTREKLQALAPQFSFTGYFRDIGSPEFNHLNVSEPKFVQEFGAVLDKTDLAIVKDYLYWHLLESSANRLNKAFVEERFSFTGRVLQGSKELRPRWKRCVSATDAALGESLGKLYVEETFGAEGKARTLAIVNEIEKQMAGDLQSLPWMSPETKKQALVKLRAVTNKIGYPDKWRDYSSVEIRPDDYFGNASRATLFEVNRQLAKIGKPTDKAEWLMTPPTVNAYYDPQQNNINFPAGILQPPFYSNKASDPVNYGAVGLVVGHELTHGFDDQGRQFDADGNLRDWWTATDAKKFEQLAQCFVNEYGGFSPVTGVELNGKLTLGENTADNGGARLAYMALMASLVSRTSPGSAADATKDGFTREQQFFLGYAQVWCENVRPEQARLWAQTNPHSPGRFRVNGVVENMPEFGKAFGCKAGDPMQKVRGCRVW